MRRSWRARPQPPALRTAVEEEVEEVVEAVAGEVVEEEVQVVSLVSPNEKKEFNF